MQYIFPAVITHDDKDRVYYVDFPDTEDYFGCYTDGNNLYEALCNADDVLNLMLLGAEKADNPIPSASDIRDIIAKAPEGAIVTLVKADTEAYAKRLADLKAARVDVDEEPELAVNIA